MRAFADIETPPRTIMEVYKQLPEGTLAELIQGIIYMSPSPVTSHQRVIMNLSNDLFNYVNDESKGEVFVAPFDVYLDEKENAVQPDIIFVSDENRHIIKDHIHGVPDMLIEVLSPGNKSHDLVRKKDLYEKFGVKEYWIIDPENKQSTGYILEGNKYQPLESNTGKIHSRILDRDFTY